MNKPAVKQLIRHLKRQQKSRAAARFNMQFFGTAVQDSILSGMLEVPVCGTQACLAGETVLEFGLGFIKRTGGIRIYKKFFDEFHGDIESGAQNALGLHGDIESGAQNALGLSSQEANNLFYFESMLEKRGRFNVGWPAVFEQQYNEAKTPADRLAATIRRVQFFYDTDGTDNRC